VAQRRSSTACERRAGEPSPICGTEPDYSVSDREGRPRSGAIKPERLITSLSPGFLSLLSGIFQCVGKNAYEAEQKAAELWLGGRLIR